MKIVVALGGNALGNNPKEQLESTRKSASTIVDLIEDGHDVIVTHGNGPQVGMINSAFELAQKSDKNIPEIPFPECSAMSQGYIGFHLQNRIREELSNREIEKNVVALVTQVLVDKEDEAFKNPTKPIGVFLDREESEKLEKESGYKFKEDSGRGYRRVVASPKPLEIIESESINTLVNNGNLVITVGGGGIPVYKNENMLIGIDCVIDKDFASARLAEEIDADLLIILTAVDRVAINFGKKNEEYISEMNLEELDEYIGQGHFAPGSMLPKVEAAREFVISKDGRRSLITSLEKAKDGIQGKTGTVIKN